MYKDLDKWIKFLNPENLQGNLISISLFIAFFELFKDSLVERVKFFFHIGFTKSHDNFSPNYKKSVLSKDKKVLCASILWLKELNAIDEEDNRKIKEIIDYRNNVTHEMMNVLFHGVSQDLPYYFANLISLSIKIDKWWTINIEIPTNPDPDFFIDSSITENDIITSTEILYRVITDMLSDDEKTATFYRNEFLKYKIQRN